MLKAIRMIKEAKKAKGFEDVPLVVDVHPSRPDYRGLFVGEKIVSLEADPTFNSMKEAGATIVKRSDEHTVLDNMFLVSGEIPRVTPYEQGLHGALRFNSSDKEWFSDEKIEDERFLMCNLKGKLTDPARKPQKKLAEISAIISRQGNCPVHRLQPCRCSQRFEARYRPPRWRCSSSCDCWRLPSRHERRRADRMYNT